MRNFKETPLRNKKVLIRCGFDVAIEDGKIIDEGRILAGLNTIRFALQQNPACLLLVSHLGRPGGERNLKFSNAPVAKRIAELLQREVRLVSDLEELAGLKERKFVETKNQICMLENLRFWPEEKASDELFSQKIANGFDVYVNDAFSVSHREHASIVGFPRFTKESATGLLFESELQNLTQASSSPDKPAVLVIGGAKIETKLPVINNLIDRYDKILVGGLIANQALDQGLDLGEKVLLPVDFAPLGKEEQRLDIGAETIKLFKQEIAKAQTIVWNGPMGKFEDEDCAAGTREILKAIEAKKETAFTLLGGGETLSAINRFSSRDNFDYVSMSGGAMLEFLAGKKIAGVDNRF